MAAAERQLAFRRGLTQGRVWWHGRWAPEWGLYVRTRHPLVAMIPACRVALHPLGPCDHARLVVLTAALKVCLTLVALRMCAFARLYTGDGSVEQCAAPSPPPPGPGPGDGGHVPGLYAVAAIVSLVIGASVAVAGAAAYGCLSAGDRVLGTVVLNRQTSHVFRCLRRGGRCAVDVWLGMVLAALAAMCVYAPAITGSFHARDVVSVAGNAFVLGLTALWVPQHALVFTALRWWHARKHATDDLTLPELREHLRAAQPS